MATPPVPKTRYLTGAGTLFRAPAGTLVPGQTSATITNKAKASNDVTLTTSAAHGFAVGAEVIVSIGDAAFDGLATTITGTTGSTIKYTLAGADVSSTAATGTAVSAPWKAGGTVAGSVFTDSWPTGWVPWGVTREGHEFTWTPSTGNIEAAEYLLPLAIVTESVEGKIAFEVIEFTAHNLASALNGAAVATVSGSGATLLSVLTPPAVGAEVRQMIGWESENHTERMVASQVFQTGDVKLAHKKGTDNAGISVEFGLEQPSIGYPFLRWYAGSVPVGV